MSRGDKDRRQASIFCFIPANPIHPNSSTNHGQPRNIRTQPFFANCIQPPYKTRLNHLFQHHACCISRTPCSCPWTFPRNEIHIYFGFPTLVFCNQPRDTSAPRPTPLAQNTYSSECYFSVAAVRATIRPLPFHVATATVPVGSDWELCPLIDSNYTSKAAPPHLLFFGIISMPLSSQHHDNCSILSNLRQLNNRAKLQTIQHPRSYKV